MKVKKQSNTKTKYRWIVCFMLLLAVTINYLDRQVLSLTWPKYIGPEFGWTNKDYGTITGWFSLFYAICMLFVGYIVDRLGTKKGFIWAIGLWSIGACSHAYCPTITAKIITGHWCFSFPLINYTISKLKELHVVSITSISVISFIYARLILALGESGNFPAAIKATAEYFPKKDRALATSIFNSGATIGAMIAPSIVFGIIALWNWEIAFIIVGLLGFIWMGIWIFFYKKPENNSKVNQAELFYIQQDLYTEHNTIEQKVSNKKISFIRCFQFKQTWSFAIGKFMTDGVWWFYLFWMPKYLETVFLLGGKDLIIPLTTLYAIVMLSIIGGWLPTFFIEKKKMNPYSGRMKAMLIFSFFPLVALLAQPLGKYSYWLSIVLIGLASAAHQAWSANIFSTIGDMFPKKAIATIIGIGGMTGGIGSFILQKTAGKLFDYTKNNQIIFGGFNGESAGYFIIFCICSIVYLIGWIIMKWLVPNYKLIMDSDL